MVKATLHLITKFVLTSIVSLFLTSCADLVLKDDELEYRQGFKSERLVSIKKHYSLVSKTFLKSFNSRALSGTHHKYLNGLLPRQAGIKISLHLIKNQRSFYLVAPNGLIIITTKFAKTYFLSEPILKAFLSEALVRIEKNAYNRVFYYTHGVYSFESITRMMTLTLQQKDILNHLSVKKLYESGNSAISYLNYIQQRNKDSLLVQNLLNGKVYGLEEERRLKTFIIQRYKSSFVKKAELEKSSRQFYSFKKFINSIRF